jgi:hypothetical protein
MNCIFSSINAKEIFSNIFYLEEENDTIDIKKEILYCSDEIKNRYGISRILFSEFENYLKEFGFVKEINNKKSISENGYEIDFIVLFFTLINHFIRHVNELSLSKRKECKSLKTLEEKLLYFYGYRTQDTMKLHYSNNNIYSSIWLLNIKNINTLNKSIPYYGYKYKELYYV